MKLKWNKRVTSMLAVTLLVCSNIVSVNAEETYESTKTVMSDVKVEGFYNETAELKITKTAGYDSGIINEEGGSAEIIQYNSDTQMYYVVNGTSGTLDIVPRTVYTDENQVQGMKFDLKTKLQDIRSEFVYGDMTSVAVNTEKDLIGVAVQAAGTNDNGVIVLIDYDQNIVSVIDAGVQPDMLTFTKDGNKILTANEGEPREGYVEGTVDPMGTITVADISSGVENAIATIDLTTNTVTSVKSLGFKDHSLEENALDVLKKDEMIQIQTEPYYGIYMPDGISIYEVGGTEYLITANEGDSREWGDYINEVEEKIGQAGSKVVFFDTSDYDGVDEDKQYLFGGRSFAIYNAATMEQVYESGSDFEIKTAEVLADYFNCSNDDKSMDDRSGKKGPEAESVVVGEVNGNTYAFIGIERIGGVMIYDITNPENSTFVNYINSRDFAEDIAGDVSPEGLSFVSASESLSKNAELLAAHEVSGTVAVYEMTEDIVEEDDTTAGDDEAAEDDGAAAGDNEAVEDGDVAVEDKDETVDEEKEQVNIQVSGQKSPQTSDSIMNRSVIWMLVLSGAVIMAALYKKSE